MSDPYTTLGLPCLTRQEANGGHGVSPDHLCMACERKTERIIGELPFWVYELSQAIGRKGGALDGPAPPGKPGSRPPINLLIDALRSEIVYTALVWEEIVRDIEYLPMRNAGAVRDGVSISISAAVLSPRTATLAAIPHAEAFFDGVERPPSTRRGKDGLRRLVDLWKAARSAVGYTRVVIHLPGECPECRAEMLRREHGSDTVWCDNCEHRLPYDHYTRWVTCLVEPA